MIDLGRLAEVQRQLLYGQPLDFQTSTWLADVVDTILSPPADVCLRSVQKAERNRLIAYLASAYYVDRSTWGAARAIRADLVRQRRTRGPALDAKGQLLRSLNQLGPILSERQIWNILSDWKERTS